MFLINNDKLEELKNQIRREKFDLALPRAMRDNAIDMWIYVVRESIPDDLGTQDFGSDNGVFIFTDRGGDRIERAILERRFKGDPDIANQGPAVDRLAQTGAYDIVGDPIDRAEEPGSAKTEYDYRFKGIGEFVTARDPKRIALNYMSTLGPHIGGRMKDGISHTDYCLLVNELGDKYAKRLVSHEHLLHDYVSQTTESELKLIKQIRGYCREVQERDWSKIVPGVTKFGELESGLWIVNEQGIRVGFNEEKYPRFPIAPAEYVIQRGDLIFLRFGYFNTELALKHLVGNYYDAVDEIGYVLREGETEPPADIRQAWTAVTQIEDIAARSIRVGISGTDAFRTMKRELGNAGFRVIDDQVFSEGHPDKVQVNIDFHAAAQGDSTVFPAPRIGTYGPDWQHNMKLPEGHHFYFEFFAFVPMPRWKARNILIQGHNGAVLSTRGVESLTPRCREMRLIR